MVGFSGSRHLTGAHFATVKQVAAAVAAAGHPVAVGCAAGADLAVRSAVPGAQVFAVAAQASRQAFAVRSVQLVQAVAASSSPALVAFPVQPCPSGLVPSKQSGKCFSGRGSGTWASVALAVGLGVPVFVFWSGMGVPVLPSWGAWVPVSSGAFAGAYQLQAGHQQSLFQ